jgi:hypothetical protein
MKRLHNQETMVFLQILETRNLGYITQLVIILHIKIKDLEDGSVLGQFVFC